MKVSRVKVSWLATSIIGDQFGASMFSDQEYLYGVWRDPDGLGLAGLVWTDPWRNERGQDHEPDRTICRQLLDDIRFTGLRTDGFLRTLFRNAIPLRAAVRTVVPSDLLAEVFLFPWGASAVLTATLDLFPAKTLQTAADTIDQWAATTSILAPPLVPNALAPSDFVVELADSVALDLETDFIEDPGLVIGPFVITTPIDGVIEDPRREPTEDPDFIYAMDRLAGQPVGMPFRYLKVSCYGRSDCVPTDVRRVMQTGMSQWVQPALYTRPTSGILRTTLGAHRNAVLRWARLTALHGELATEWRGWTPSFFRTQLNTHRLLLGRLLNAPGPNPDWTAQFYVLEQNITHLLPAPDIDNPGWCPPDDS